MADRTSGIDAIVGIMKSEWDLPADCNAGELYAYAEILFDRIRAGEDKAGLYGFASATQGKLDLAPSETHLTVVDQAMEAVRARSSGA